MGLIKSNHLRAATVGAFSMADVERQAQATLAEAKQTADRIIAAAEAEARAIREKTYNKAHAEGLAAGQKQGRDQAAAQAKTAALAEQKGKLTEVIQSLSRAMQAVEESRRSIEADGCAAVMKLALEIATRVVHHVGIRDPDCVRENIRRAVKLCLSRTDLRIAIHPSHRQALASIINELKLSFPKLQHVELIDELAITPGGCRVYTTGGQIDADLDQQLAAIARELMPDAAIEAEAPVAGAVHERLTADEVLD
jgi:flagellar biosynthesis/type III secretory pathway protein FliH